MWEGSTLRQCFNDQNCETKGELHKLSESSGFGGTMCAGMSISAMEAHLSTESYRALTQKDEPLSERFPFRYSGVPIVSNTSRSFSVMCR